MKHKRNARTSYLPWLILLFGADGFFALLLWIADAKAFRSLSLTLFLSTALLSLFLCSLLQKRRQKAINAYHAFLDTPDEVREETLIKTADPSLADAIRLLGQKLRQTQNDCSQVQACLSEYEAYVETWAHEIKAPLSLLSLLLDNHREELPDGVGHKFDYTASRMQEFVDQMLFYARLKGVQKDYLFEHLSLEQCIQETLEYYEPLLTEKGFQIHIQTAGSVIYSDRRGFCFLLRQFVSNTVKYSAENPTLAFVWEQHTSRGILHIRDNGIGAHPCDLPYLFIQGFTGDSGENRKQATGMGLYLAKEIARELHIALEAESAYGHGFEMRVIFPIVSQSSDDALQLPSNQTSNLGKLHIL